MASTREEQSVRNMLTSCPGPVNRFYFWRVWCIALLGKYINPSWRSLIEMNKITFSPELLFILPHSQRTINLQHSNSRKETQILVLMSSLTACILVPPLDVSIFAGQPGSHSAGKVTTFHCQSHGSNPPARLAWFDYQGTKIKEATSEVCPTCRNILLFCQFLQWNRWKECGECLILWYCRRHHQERTSLKILEWSQLSSSLSDLFSEATLRLLDIFCLLYQQFSQFFFSLKQYFGSFAIFDTSRMYSIMS